MTADASKPIWYMLKSAKRVSVRDKRPENVIMYLQLYVLMNVFYANVIYFWFYLIF